MKFRRCAIWPWMILKISWMLMGCAESSELQHSRDNSTSTINGICIEGPPRPVDHAAFDGLVETGANWVAITPYAFLAKGETQLNWDSQYTWWGEKKIGVKACVELAKEKGFQVMLKPHVWIAKGEYTGTLSFETEKNWLAFENSYRQYVLEYMNMFQHHELSMLCLGTELDEFARQRPDFWIKLANEMAEKFNVQLTYSANWDSYAKLGIWSAMDYIGISAYFPLKVKNTRSIMEITQAWQPHLDLMASLNKREQKPIVFTEYGYRSIPNCIIQPWVSDTEEIGSETEQELAYRVLYETFWNEPWFAGGFSWKWYVHNNYPKERLEVDYSVQGKAALTVLRSHYSSSK